VPCDPPALTTALLALLAALPASASAAVVSMSSSSGPAAETYVDYQASKGEANKVVVRKSGRFVFFTDTGAKTLVAKRDKIFGNCVKTAAKTVAASRRP
jgi:hypothetical protein